MIRFTYILKNIFPPTHTKQYPFMSYYLYPRKPRRQKESRISPFYGPIRFTISHTGTPRMIYLHIKRCDAPTLKLKNATGLHNPTFSHPLHHALDTWTYNWLRKGERFIHMYLSAWPSAMMEWKQPNEDEWQAPSTPWPGAPSTDWRV